MSNNKVMIQRSPPPTYYNSNSDANYSTAGDDDDDYNNEYSNSNPHVVTSRKHKRREKRSGPRRAVESLAREAKGSVVWVVLMIGLVFCMLDALYLSMIVQHDPRHGTAAAAAASTLQDLRAELQAVKQELEHVRQGKPKDDAAADAAGAIALALADKVANKNKKKGFLDHEFSVGDEGKPISDYRERAKADGKTRILDLIEAASPKLDDETYEVLPTWDQVVALYGAEPRIYGLDQCEVFRSRGDPADHFVSTAGAFNSGTNLMAELLIHNCHMQDRMDKYGAVNRGIRWQVPWGKHTPPGDDEFRHNHKTMKDKEINADMIMPAVTIRDPFFWMKSMCKHQYTATWAESSLRCPNLVPLEADIAEHPFLQHHKEAFPVHVKYSDFTRQHDSLVGFYNDWYMEYQNVTFPHLVVRFEDLVFHPQELTKTVCECAGGSMDKHKFRYVVESAKRGVGAHGNVRTGYMDAIIKYGTEKDRFQGFFPQDLEYANQHLNADFMQFFNYQYATPQDVDAVAAAVQEQK